jgi:hypothetical protein
MILRAKFPNITVFNEDCAEPPIDSNYYASLKTCEKNKHLLAIANYLVIDLEIFKFFVIGFPVLY